MHNHNGGQPGVLPDTHQSDASSTPQIYKIFPGVRPTPGKISFHNRSDYGLPMGASEPEWGMKASILEQLLEVM
jgi:hypothetical protein